jgi:hypothetical protein
VRQRQRGQLTLITPLMVHGAEKEMSVFTEGGADLGLGCKGWRVGDGECADSKQPQI